MFTTKGNPMSLNVFHAEFHLRHVLKLNSKFQDMRHSAFVLAFKIRNNIFCITMFHTFIFYHRITYKHKSRINLINKAPPYLLALFFHSDVINNVYKLSKLTLCHASVVHNKITFKISLLRNHAIR